MPLTRRAALAPLLALALLSAAAGVAHAELNNTVTQWLAQAQQAVRADGIQNQLSTRLYALVALAQLRAIDATPQLDPTVAAGARCGRALEYVCGCVGRCTAAPPGHPSPPLAEPARLPRPPKLPAAVAGHAVLATLFPFNQSAVYDGLLKAQIANATGGKPFTPAQIAARKAVSQIAKDLITEYTGGASAEYPIDFKFAAPGETYKYQATPGQKYALYPQVRWVCTRLLDSMAGDAVADCASDPTSGLTASAVPPTWTPRIGSPRHSAGPRPAGPAPSPPPDRAAPSVPPCTRPQLANAKPIVVASARLDAIAGNTNAAKGPVFRPPSPHGADYEATRLLGSNATDSTRSKYDSDTAIFWADGGNTSAISGHWLDIAKKVGTVLAPRLRGLLSFRAECGPGRACV